MVPVEEALRDFPRSKWMVELEIEQPLPVLMEDGNYRQ